MRSRRSVCAVLVLCLLVVCFSGCAQEENKQISCDDVIAAYQNAGYAIFHIDTAAEAEEWLCCVSAEDEEYIYFYFFEDNETAQDYADERQWNVVLWLYSLAMFEPTWVSTKVYGNIVYQYSDSDLLKPFNDLTK